ncbi:PepSY-like domain-containing protein [Bacteroides thetaiotaomicron]|uniref:PepSY-like domain-containing protein n=1 Tax=Bacteroides thetaiotaomicron TaxID=818 RepID=UPI0039C1B401
MKKLVFLLVCLFTLQTVARADDDKPIQVTQMPQLAQQFIKQHFSDSKVALAKMESDFLYKSYEVIFTNGNKVEFDKKGNWEEVDCKHTSVPVAIIPAAIIPAAIQKYVTTNYPDAKVLKIERDKKDYEVKLSNRTELKFDLKFNLIDIDN